MALWNVRKLADGVLLGIWKVDEMLDYFTSEVGLYEFVTREYASSKRRLEVFCTHALLHEMTGDSSLRISHLPSGKPVCEGYNIGISHTLGWVALIISPIKPVSIDIEYRSNRVSRIASRFLRKDENFVSVNQQLVCWCVKETAYKYYSEQNLMFEDMYVRDFQCLQKGEVLLDNLKEGTSLRMNYEMNDDYVLVWASAS